MYAIKKFNGTFSPSRFETLSDAQAAFTPTPFGQLEIVECDRPQADHETKADFGIEPFPQALRVAQRLAR